MTPEQKKSAEEFCCRAKLAASATLAPAPIADLMMSALAQLDADEKRRKDDEGLMRNAAWVLRFAKPRLPAWPDTGERILCALRARLGEPAPAPEEPKT